VQLHATAKSSTCWSWTCVAPVVSAVTIGVEMGLNYGKSMMVHAQFDARRCIDEMAHPPS